MSNRIPLSFNATYGFPETFQAGDNLDMQTTGKIVNLAAATAGGDALAYGQAGASLAGLALTAALLMGGNAVQNVASPSSASDAATKGYVDGLINGVSWKVPVKAVATSNVSPLSGLATTVDGVALDTDGYRILLTAQSTATENGPWVVHSGAWTRPTDTAAGAHAADYAYFVEQGTTYADTGWVCTTDSPSDVVGTNNLAFTQFSSAGVTTASHGLTKIGNDIQVNPGDGINFDGGNIHTQVALDATAPGLQFTGSTPNGRLQVKADANGGVQVQSAGVSVKIASANELSADSGGLHVVGVPLQFKINGSTTSTSVTASNVNTLVAGATSNADSLHSHSVVRGAYTSVDALSSGDPVYWSSTADQVGKALANTNSKSFVFGVNSNASVSATGTAQVICRGVNAGVLSGATPGAPYYLQPTGGIGTSAPAIGSNSRIIQVGVAKNASDLWVEIRDYGKVF